MSCQYSMWPLLEAPNGCEYDYCAPSSPLISSSRMSRKKSGFFGRMLFFATSLMIVSNVLITFLQTSASIANYPGGQALALFNEKYANSDHSA